VALPLPRPHACRADPSLQYVLGYIVERKTAADLADFVSQPRFAEQSFLLRHCGLQHKILLVVRGVTVSLAGVGLGVSTH
jgi:hypothetical protein